MAAKKKPQAAGELDPENIPTTDSLGAEVNTPAVATIDLDPQSTCDFDRARMHVVRRQNFNDVPHEVRECSADPNHVKIVAI